MVVRHQYYKPRVSLYPRIVWLQITDRLVQRRAFFLDLLAPVSFAHSRPTFSLLHLGDVFWIWWKDGWCFFDGVFRVLDDIYPYLRVRGNAFFWVRRRGCVSSFITDGWLLCMLLGMNGFVSSFVCVVLNIGLFWLILFWQWEGFAILIAYFVWWDEVVLFCSSTWGWDVVFCLMGALSVLVWWPPCPLHHTQSKVSNKARTNAVVDKQQKERNVSCVTNFA